MTQIVLVDAISEPYEVCMRWHFIDESKKCNIYLAMKNSNKQAMQNSRFFIYLVTLYKNKCALWKHLITYFLDYLFESLPKGK